MDVSQKTREVAQIMAREYELVRISHSCGHTDTVRITKYKKPGNRKRKLDELSSWACQKCFFEKTLAEHDLKPLQVHYSDFKDNYKDCLTDWDSYDPVNKRITVYVRNCYKTGPELAFALVDEFGISEAQAQFLATRSSHLLELRQWLMLDPLWKLYKEVLARIDENNPSYKYEQVKREEALDDTYFREMEEYLKQYWCEYCDDAVMETRAVVLDGIEIRICPDCLNDKTFCVRDKGYLSERIALCDGCTLEGCPWSVFLKDQEPLPGLARFD